ncbi:MAG: type IV secretion system protein [Alphaproteobacteria bacterium]
MEKNLGIQNQKQQMIGSRVKRVAVAAPKKSSGDVFVANVAEKRYLWTARAFSIIFAVSLCCNIVLVIAITKVIPLYRVEPFLLTFQNKEEQVYNISSIKSDLRQNKAVTEALIRQYVLLRSTFLRDVLELETRWMPGGPIQETSSATVYSEFLEKTAKPAINLVKTRGLTRDVKLLSVNELSTGLWQVEYEAQDVLPSSQDISSKFFTASIKVVYVPQTVKYDERLKNPLGFKVIRYALQQNKVD